MRTKRKEEYKYIKLGWKRNKKNEENKIQRYKIDFSYKYIWRIIFLNISE